MLSLRGAGADDVPLMAAWNVQLHEDEGSVPMTVPAAEDRLRQWLSGGAFHGMIFAVSSEDVGYLLYEELPPDPALRGSQSALYVRQFFIVRHKRRNGLGRAAFQRFLANHNTAGLPVVLDVKATNPAGHSFWTSLGFAAQHTNYRIEV